mmetsp:Transcript_31352/g.61899  ORF Transcript_31352/g.61899 Transcript_31352/m.61899 type:complete len:127 (+) Transcript_31352:79-459(+)
MNTQCVTSNIRVTMTAVHSRLRKKVRFKWESRRLRLCVRGLQLAAFVAEIDSDRGWNRWVLSLGLALRSVCDQNKEKASSFAPCAASSSSVLQSLLERASLSSASSSPSPSWSSNSNPSYSAGLCE